MTEEELYEHLDLGSQVKNWNDFCQPKFQTSTLNEIRTVDVDKITRNSYLKGFDFFDVNNFSNYYLDNFQNSFRKQLEDCDYLETIHMNAENNGIWGGLW